MNEDHYQTKMINFIDYKDMRETVEGKGFIKVVGVDSAHGRAWKHPDRPKALPLAEAYSVALTMKGKTVEVIKENKAEKKSAKKKKDEMKEDK